MATTERALVNSVYSCVSLTLENVKIIHFICKYRVIYSKPANIDSRGGYRY